MDHSGLIKYTNSLTLWKIHVPTTYSLLKGLVKILQQFEIRASSKTPDQLEFDEGSVRVAKNGINVIFYKRN